MIETNWVVETESPADRPITLADIKRHSVIEHDDDDYLLLSMLDAAVDYAQQYMNRQIIDAEFTAFYSCFDPMMELPVYEASSITEIKYYDTDNAEQTLDSSVYELVRTLSAQAVGLAYNQVFPDTYPREDAVSVRFRAGYASRNAVPATIKIGLLMLVRQYDEYREGTKLNSVSEVPAGVSAHFDHYRHYVAG